MIISGEIIDTSSAMNLNTLRQINLYSAQETIHDYGNCLKINTIHTPSKPIFSPETLVIDGENRIIYYNQGDDNKPIEIKLVKLEKISEVFG